MKFQLALLAPVIALFVASVDVVRATTSATTCVSNCFNDAAAFVGCSALDVACVKEVRVAFQASVQQCLEVNACTSLAEGTQAEFDAASDTVALHAALLPESEYDGMLDDANATILSRVVPRSSLTERAYAVQGLLGYYGFGVGGGGLVLGGVDASFPPRAVEALLYLD